MIKHITGQFPFILIEVTLDAQISFTEINDRCAAVVDCALCLQLFNYLLSELILPALVVTLCNTFNMYELPLGWNTVILC